MRWAARALALLAVLAGCGQYGSARVEVLAPSQGTSTGTGMEPVDPSVDAGRVAGRERERDRSPANARSRARHRTGAAAAPSPPSPGPDAGTSPSRIAVVVGIDEYPGGRDLGAAEADARAVALALGRLGFSERHTLLLLGRTATADALRVSLEWLARRSGPRTVGVFFFAGHIRKVAGDPDGDGEELDEALVGSDGALVTDGAVASALAPARGRLWLAYAGCYAGGFADAAGPGRISTYASGEDELAYESAALGHSFMVEYMVRRAMPDGGPVSVEQLYRRTAEEMDGRMRRFRPLQHDAAAGDLVLGALPPEPVPRPPRDRDRPCLVVLRCAS